MSGFFSGLPVILQTALLLAISNVFMTFAWYAHLKNLSDRPWWWIAALASWAIALFVVVYMQQPLKLDYLWAGLCMLGAVYFIFRYHDLSRQQQTNHPA